MTEVVYKRGENVEFEISGVWWPGRIAAVEGDSVVIVTRKAVGHGKWVTVSRSGIRIPTDGTS